MSYKILDAVINCQYSQLLLFLRHNYNFKIKSAAEGYNVLMVALQIQDQQKRFKMFKFLLKQELVDLLDTDIYGHDIFFATVLRCCENELKLLMKNFHMEVDWSRMDRTGKTILHYAVINNNLTILETLLTYCSKYKINVDIPDKINKITPYLLACRLNYHEAADLLVRIGRASKSQADRTVFYDAERWKQEGQIEKLKDFLKSKEEDMNIAKINGNLKVYRELSQISRTLDNELYRNSDMLPVLAKVLIDHDKENNQNLFITRAQTCQYMKLINPTKMTHRPVYSSNIFKKNVININNCNYFLSREQKHYNFNKSTTSSFSNSTTTPISSASSSAFSYYNLKRNLDQTLPIKEFERKKSTTVDLSDINSILKQTMNNIIKKRTSVSPQVNSLLEMASNQQTVENFCSSKSDAEISGVSTSMSSNQTRVSSFNDTRSSTHLSQMFLAAALQQTGNFRSAAKPIEQKPKPEKTIQVKPKTKTGLSTLAIIREESRTSRVSSKKKPKTKLLPLKLLKV